MSDDAVENLSDTIKHAMWGAQHPQPTFTDDGAVIIARLDVAQMVLIVRSLQADAKRARAETGNEWAQECAAQREALAQQMMLHLTNALSDYQPEDCESSHSVSDSFLKSAGLVPGTLPQDEPKAP